MPHLARPCGWPHVAWGRSRSMTVGRKNGEIFTTADFAAPITTPCYAPSQGLVGCAQGLLQELLILSPSSGITWRYTNPERTTRMFHCGGGGRENGCRVQCFKQVLAARQMPMLKFGLKSNEKGADDEKTSREMTHVFGKFNNAHVPSVFGNCLCV